VAQTAFFRVEIEYILLYYY